MDVRQQKVEAQLARLPAMARAELEVLWRELFERPLPARLRRETLIPVLGHRLQERAYGGWKESTLRRLRELAVEPAGSLLQPMLRPKAGTRYVREHGGTLHEVTVLEAGYEYQGQIYRSLTAIARRITGTPWSGPAFFGQRRRSIRGSRLPSARSGAARRRFPKPR
jgi:hypothetical protein